MPSPVLVFLHYLCRIYLMQIHHMMKIPIWYVDTLLKQYETLKACDLIIDFHPKSIGNHL